MPHHLEDKSNTYIVINKNCVPQVNFRTLLNKNGFSSFLLTTLLTSNVWTFYMKQFSNFLQTPTGYPEFNASLALSTQMQCKPLRIRVQSHKTDSHPTQLQVADPKFPTLLVNLPTD